MPDDVPLNWNDLANTRVGEVEPPKLIPVGHYQGHIKGAVKVENKGKKKTLCATFPIVLTEPLSDVDEEAFSESDGFRKDGYELQFWLTPASLFRFTEFGKALGASEDMSIPEMAEFLADCGESFAIQASHRQDEQHPNRVYLDLDNPIALADYTETR